MPTPRPLNTRHGLSVGTKSVVDGSGTLTDVGLLSDLDTADTTSIVNAVNEVKGDFENITTDEVAEGLSNLYFTTQRARDSFSPGTGVYITDGEVSVGQSVDTTSNVTFNDLTLSGSLNGPSIMYIDPASLGDDTGEVVIRGSLTVKGTTTTIDSTSVEIADVNILLARNAANAAQADGAGISVAGSLAEISYNASGDSWDVNKQLSVEAGTASAPSYSFRTDPDTGIYLSGTNSLSIATNGTEYVSVDSAGDVTLYGGDIVFNRTTYGVTLGSLSLTENRTVNLPDTNGTIITSGDTGTVTSVMIADGTIVDADISATAEIAVSKLADGAARQLLQTAEDGVGVEWTDNVDVPGTLDVTGISTFDTKIRIGAAETANEREVAWNTDEGTLDLQLLNGVITRVGQDTITLCRNNTLSPIPKGTAVMFNGTVGNSGRIAVAPMVANGTVPGYVFFGVTDQAIAAGEDGYVKAFGEVKGIDTTSYAEGTVLWCNPAVPGGFTATEPAAPNLKLPVAAVISSGNNGIVMVRWTTGSRLRDLHDVESNGTTANGEILVYNSTAMRWEHGSTLPTLSLTSSLVFEGSTADDFETTLSVVDPTSDRSILLPNVSGTVVTTGDTGTVTSTMIADGTIVDADINASAAIEFSKLATLSSGNILVGSSGNVATSVAVTGDVTLSNTGAATVISGSTNVAGKLQLTDSTSSTSTTTAATPASVKTAYDLAAAALPKSGGTMTGTITFAAGQTLSGYVATTDIGVTVQAYNVNNAVTNTLQTFTAAQRGGVVTLTPAGTVTPDFATGNNFTLSLDQATTLANPTNLAAGQSGAIRVVQDSTARTLSYGSYWYFEGGVPTLGTTTGATSVIAYYVDSTTHITAKLINQPTNT